MKTYEINKKLLSITIIAALIAGMLGGIGSFYLLSNNLEQLAAKSPTNLNTTQVVVEESQTINAISKVAPSVVSIIASKQLALYKRPTSLFDLFAPQMGIPGLQQMPEKMLEQAPEQQTDSVKRKIGGGTGFIISTDGLVLTNKHVIADSQAEYSVLLSDGTTMYATVLSKDPINDLAFIQLYTDQDRTDKPSELLPVELGNSDKLQVGSKVIAIGNALSEFDNTTTSGIISGLGRSITASNGNGSASRLSNLLQTDASINPGNSGGPLVNILGQVIGINTAIAQSANGIGFAIPINEAKAVVKSVQEFGKIVRPMLGVRYVEISQEIATELELPVDYGAFLQDDIARGVRSVLEDGPADKAGLRGGDIILAINGVALNESTSLQREISKFMPADTIKLTVYRADKEIDINVKLGEFSAEST